MPLLFDIDIMPQCNFHGKIYSALLQTMQISGGLQLLITFKIWANILKLVGNWKLLANESEANNQYFYKSFLNYGPNLLAPTGALVLMMVYYISINPLFSDFEHLCLSILLQVSL